MFNIVDQEDFVRWMLTNMSILSLDDKKAILEGLKDLIRKDEVNEQLKHGRD